LSREILIVTPENIEIEYELAGIGSRFLANLIDQVWQVIIIIGVGFAVLILTLIGAYISSLAHFSAQWAGFMSFMGDILVSVLTIATYLLIYGYFVYFEIRWNGQTPGKRALGLRVIRDGGYPITPFSAFARNLLRTIDGMPFLTLPALIAGLYPGLEAVGALAGAQILLTVGFLLFSSRSQRLGDFIAGTMVVKQRAPRIPTLEALAPPPRVMPERLAAWALADIGRHVYDMTIPEYRAVRYFTDRRWQMPWELQRVSAMWLAVPLMKRLNLEPPPGSISVNYVDLLEYLAVAFEQYRGVK